MVVTLTTEAKNWLAMNAGVGNCFSPTGVSYTDADNIPHTGSTGDVVNAFMVAHLVGNDIAIIIAGMDYTHFKTINGGVDIGFDDVNFAYTNDGSGSLPAYCVTPANIVSTTLTLSTNSCTEPCNVTGSVSWENIGGIAGTFDPAMLINGTPTSLGSAETLSPGQTTTHGFSLPPNLTVGTYDVCASPGTHCQTLVVSPAPANVISATLTVDTNDCTTPCTTNGTASWANTGGTASDPIDLGITVNGALTTLDTGIVIDPGATTLEYPFTLTDLAAGTYSICASPNSGTSCQSVLVRTPADITTTNMVLTPSTCIEPCDTLVEVTYINSGQTAGTFTPEITVDGVPVQLSPDTLGPGIEVTKSFGLTGKTIGTYTICAVPIGATTCQTLTVNQVQEAALGPLLIGGLAVGVLFASQKKRTEEHK